MKKQKIILTALTAFALASGAYAGEWQYPQQVASAVPAAIVDTAAPVGVAPYFTINASDIGNAVAAQIKSQGIETKDVKATLLPGMPNTIYGANHPLSVSLQALQIDKSAHRWQGQAYIIGNGQTETVRPLAGFYETEISVPVLTRQLGQNDVIAASDIELHQMPERLLHKDTITDQSQLIGRAARRTISAERPIRSAEVQAPVVVKKGDALEITYTTPYLHIRATAEALEDGSVGELIRVKNSKTGKAVSTRVVEAGHVEANMGEM